MTIDAKKPLKEWRILSTSKRLAAELNRYVCLHEPGHKHDPIEGGRMAELSGVYNVRMATAILASLFPQTMFKNVPSMSVVPGAVAHFERGLLMGQTVLGLVHSPMSRDEMMTNPKALEKLREEAQAMRDLKVWKDEEPIELDELKAFYKKKNETIHIGEIMPICHVKNSELHESLHKIRARLVFRGDACKDQFGNIAFFRESIPATVSTINLLLYYGFRSGNECKIADAAKAYLQAPLRTKVKTFVIIPRIIWHDHWEPKFKRVAAQLQMALYGHPESGDDWSLMLGEVITKDLQGIKIDASLWWIPALEVMVGAYVDDILASGPKQALVQFWSAFQAFIKLDEIQTPGRYLGRDHLIFETSSGRHIFLSMTDFALSAITLYESMPGVAVLKTSDRPYVSESALIMEHYSETGQLASSAARLLMKLLWLARLCRPDLSFAISHLASYVSKWNRNCDKMLLKLMGFVKATTKFGIHATVSRYPESPVLDADLAGDPMSARSHSGTFIVLVSENGTFFPVSWASKTRMCVTVHNGGRSRSGC